MIPEQTAENLFDRALKRVLAKIADATQGNRKELVTIISFNTDPNYSPDHAFDLACSAVQYAVGYALLATSSIPQEIADTHKAA